MIQLILRFDTQHEAMYFLVFRFFLFVKLGFGVWVSLWAIVLVCFLGIFKNDLIFGKVMYLDVLPCFVMIFKRVPKNLLLGFTKGNVNFLW